MIKLLTEDELIEMYVRNTIYYMYENNILALSKHEKGFDLVKIIGKANLDFIIEFDLKLRVARETRLFLNNLYKKGNEDE